MAVNCAKPGCVQDRQPEGQRRLSSFVTLLCGDGEGNHKHNSGYAHVSCAEDLDLTLMSKVGFLPYSHEMVMAYDPTERKVSEHRTNAYYFCGQVACLVRLLQQYGNEDMKQLLADAENDPELAMHNISPIYDQRTREQLAQAIEFVGRRARPHATQQVIQQQVDAWQQHAEVYKELRAAGDLQVGAALDEAGRPDVKEVRPPGIFNVLVVGGGAVGGFFASRLLMAGHEVVVMERPDYTEALRSTGFRLQDGRHLNSARPVAVVSTLAEAFPAGVEYDLLILATKAYDAPDVLKALPSSRFPLPRKVMTVQNGVDTEETAARILGANRVLAATLTTPVSRESLGYVTVEQQGRGVGLAPLVSGEAIDEWVSLFEKAGLTTWAISDYRAMKWSKLFVNVIANASCAVLNRKPSVIYGYRPTFMLEREMLREVLAVMKEMAIAVVDLPGSQARLLARGITYLPALIAQLILKPQIERARGNKMPSLYLDLAAGRQQSEVVYLNGAVVRYGRQLGVPTPVNFMLTDTLHKLATGALLWDDFRGKPAALLARMRAAGPQA